MEVMCPYCANPCNLVTGLTIYPDSKKFWPLWFWQCKPCNAYVGCHPDTKIALGKPAKDKLRMLRSRAHKALDRFWRNGKYQRSEVYKRLAKRMGIKSQQCHIAMFAEGQCQAVIKLCNNCPIKVDMSAKYHFKCSECGIKWNAETVDVSPCLRLYDDGL